MIFTCRWSLVLALDASTCRSIVNQAAGMQLYYVAYWLNGIALLMLWQIPCMSTRYCLVVRAVNGFLSLRL